MKKLVLVAALGLTGCSAIPYGVLDYFKENDCSSESKPICIEIPGKRGHAMNDLSGIVIGRHFKLEDFACKCGCGEVNYSPRLVSTLDKLQDHFKKDVVITSGFRCAKRNKEVGGVKDSLHLKGQAVDFVVKGVSPAKVAAYLSDFDGGVGLYERHVHIDDGLKRMWKGQYNS